MSRKVVIKTIDSDDQSPVILAKGGAIKGITVGANQRLKFWHPGEMDHPSQVPKKAKDERG